MYRHLETFYETHDEELRFSENSGRVEFLTTLRYIEKYLFPGARILEIGAGSGRYSHALANAGYETDAVELLDGNLEKIRSRVKDGEPLRIFKGNALNLDFLKEEQYDLVLLLGPMYHLYTLEDKRRALSQAMRTLKKGGVLMIAYCMADAAILSQCFLKNNAQMLIEKGLLNPVTFETFSTPEEVFELITVNELLKIPEGFPLSRLHLVSTDLFTHFLKESVDRMDENAFAFYMQYHFAVCERPDLIGAGCHTLDILKKE